MAELPVVDMEVLAKQFDHAAWKGFNQSESEFEKGYKHAMSVAARVVRESAPASPAALRDEGACGYCAAPEHFTGRIEMPHRQGAWHRSELGGYYRCTAPNAARDEAKNCVKCGHNAFNGRYCEAESDHPSFQARWVSCGCLCKFATTPPSIRATAAAKIADQLIPHLDHAFLLTKGWRDQIASIIERSLSSGS